MPSYSELRDLIKKYERHVSVGAVVFGFIWDSLTLGRPDSLFNNIVFVAYLTIAAGAIVIIAIYERQKREPPILALPVMQFSFGNLAGGLFVVYGQSGSFEGNWLFFLILLAFLFGNEFLRTYYARLSFHIAAWYFLLFAYVAIIVPILFGSVGDALFVLSGIVSLAFVTLFLLLLRSIARERVVLARRQNILLIASVFALWNALYFTHVLPPVPLALTSIGVYHHMVKLSSGDYEATYERPEWWQFTRATSNVFVRPTGAPAYCASAVFAPARLSANIEHHWEHYDEAAKEWDVRSIISFPVSGGREEGYRGYSIKFDLPEGRWRCSVRTAGGGLVGRTTFEVREGIPELERSVW